MVGARHRPLLLSPTTHSQLAASRDARPGSAEFTFILEIHPGGNPGANLDSISHRYYLREVAFEWELTKDVIYLPLVCLQGGEMNRYDDVRWWR